MPLSLKSVPVPEVPGLLDGSEPIVINEPAAIALGKALFWDVNVGSDGVACASCHFHAGADSRTVNQIAPTGNSADLGSAAFDTPANGLPPGPNHRLARGDFPFVQSTDPLRETALYGFSGTADDVGGSAGTFGGTFVSVELADVAADTCSRSPDAVFHQSAVGTREVTRRNAPTVITAAFNHRNFWDGRANNVFNGSSGWGARDSAAGVWVKNADGSVTKTRLHLVNASLASQALGPPSNTVEMSCAGRTLAGLGRKLLMRRPLEHHAVDATDGVLGALGFSKPGAPQPALDTYYFRLVRRAVNPKYWSATQRGPFGAPPPAAPGARPLAYSQLEANFGMFFGLALQLYESTLVSDDSPFDRSQRDANGIPIDLTPVAVRGMAEFRNTHCNPCHVGPTFSAAAIHTIAEMFQADQNVFRDTGYPFSIAGSAVIRLATAKGSTMVDVGFAATGVSDDTQDAGIAGKDDFGHPLSYVPQYFDFLAGNAAGVLDPQVAQIRACDLGVPLALNTATPNALWFTQREGVISQPQPTDGCRIPSRRYVPTPAAAAAELAKPNSLRFVNGTDGAFKIPTLRNVELTGPYMHDGGMATLEQVIAFYTRGGTHEGASKNIAFVFAQTHLAVDPAMRADLLEFLKSLTDERVRYERAPFDHPELVILEGHGGDAIAAGPGNPPGAALATDRRLTIPAVGAAGRTTPLPTFESRLAP